MDSGALDGATSMPDDGRFDAFISYRRIPADIAFVDRLEQDLAARGMRVWVDREKIEPASDWAQRIDRAIKASKALMFVITPESARSAECLRELDLAARLNKLIVPVLLRGVPDQKELPATLTRPNWVVYSDGSDGARAIDQLTEALGEDLDWRDEHSRYTIRGGEWDGAGHDKSFLLRGSDLRRAEDWLAAAPAHPKTPPTAAQTAYIVASRKASVRVQRTWQAALSAGLAIAIGLAVLALAQRDQAQHEAQVANSRADAVQAVAELTSNPEQSVSDALSATKINASPQAEQALRLAIAADRLRMTIKSGTGAHTAAAWSPVHGQLAVSAVNGGVALWDSATGRMTQLLSTGGKSPVIQLTYDGSGNRLAAVTTAFTVSVWDIAWNGTATPVPTADVNAAIRAQLVQDATYVNPKIVPIQAAWDAADGSALLVFGRQLNNVVICDFTVPDAEPLFASGGQTSNDHVVPSPDESGMLTNGQILYFASQVPLSPPIGDSGPSCWFADGSAVVTSSDDLEGSTVRTYNAKTGRQSMADMRTPASPVTAVACGASAGDQWVAAGDIEGNVILRMADGSVVPLAGHSDYITSIASSPDGRYLATASDDGTAQIWNAGTGKLVTTLGGTGGPGLLSVQFAPDSRRVLTVDEQGFARVWDAGIGEPAAELAAPAQGTAIPLGFIGSGRQVSGIDVDTSTGTNAGITSVAAVTWSAATGQLERSVPLPGIAPTAMPCSAALKNLGGPIATTTSCELPPPPRLAQAVGFVSTSGYLHMLAVAASPDGTDVAYARAHSVAVLDSAGRQVAALPVAGSLAGLAFGPGPGDLLVMTSTAIYLWQPLAGRPPLEVAQPSAPIDAAVSADGSVLAAADTGGTVGVWNAVTGKAIRTFRPADDDSSSYFRSPMPLRVAVSADGRVVASGSADGAVFLWDTASGKRIAVQRVSTWPIIELSPALSGSALLAVNWPKIQTGGTPAGAGEVLSFATGGVMASYTAPPVPDPDVPIAPGAGLSPDGAFVYAGSLGLAPAPPGGNLAVYLVPGGQAMTAMPAYLASGAAASSEFPAQPWSPDGTTILAGNGLYRCDACQALPGLQATAASRVAWEAPLSAGSGHPPATDPYA